MQIYTHSIYVWLYPIPLAPFLPDLFSILYKPSKYFSVLPLFLLSSHCALPPKFDRIPLCFLGVLTKFHLQTFLLSSLVSVQI